MPNKTDLWLQVDMNRPADNLFWDSVLDSFNWMVPNQKITHHGTKSQKVLIYSICSTMYMKKEIIHGLNIPYSIKQNTSYG